MCLQLDGVASGNNFFFLLQPLSSYDKVLVFVMVSVNRVRVQVCVFVCG